LKNGFSLKNPENAAGMHPGSQGTDGGAGVISGNRKKQDPSRHQLLI
jgi:hypothetical protein